MLSCLALAEPETDLRRLVVNDEPRSRQMDIAYAGEAVCGRRYELGFGDWIARRCASRVIRTPAWSSRNCSTRPISRPLIALFERAIDLMEAIACRPDVA